MVKMFGLRFKSPFREYEYSRFSKENKTVCTVYERQYNPVLDTSTFGLIGWFLYCILSCILKFEYSFNIGMIFFIIFMFIRLSTITEKDKKSDKGE